MARIVTRKADVLWSYIGTALSYGAGFVQLPFMLLFLNPEELGLWYVYTAFAAFTTLFEFGFNPTFARNIVYVMSGARRLKKAGFAFESIEDGVDWHLLNSVIKASRIIYAAVATLALIISATVGSAYIGYITYGSDINWQWLAWTVFCIAIFLNLLYLHYVTFTQGIGDLAGMNRAKTTARISQLAVTVALLAAGWGLLGAAIGYVTNGLILRFKCRRCIKNNEYIVSGTASDNRRVSTEDLKHVLASVSHLAWRDGVMELCVYGATQAMTIVCSAILTLAETGTYSISFQIAIAVAYMALAYAQSRFPMHQSAYTEGDLEMQRRIVSESVVAYWAIGLLGTAIAAIAIFPLLAIIRQDVTFNVSFFLLLSVYLLLWHQHSMFAIFILNTNRIPYMKGYILSAIGGVILAVLLIAVFNLGIWGLALGPLLAQISYNNWRWPCFVTRELKTSYIATFRNGCVIWANRASALWNRLLKKFESRHSHQ